MKINGLEEKLLVLSYSLLFVIIIEQFRLTPDELGEGNFIILIIAVVACILPMARILALEND